MSCEDEVSGDAEGFDEDEQFVYIQADDDRVFEEDEVQIALATYQEVRKAISPYQKGRQFYRGKGGRRGSGGPASSKARRRYISKS